MTINDLILGFTFLAIVWYSFETRGLRKATIHQIHLGISPYLLLTTNYENKGVAMSNMLLQVKNIGNGVALNVFSDEHKLLDNNKEVTYTMQLMDTLSPGEFKDIQIQSIRGK